MNDPIILQMAQNISAIQTSLNDFRKEMMGNGQPGRIQILETNVAETSDDVRVLQQARAFQKGAQTRLAGYVSVGVTAGITALWEILRRHFGWLK